MTPTASVVRRAMILCSCPSALGTSSMIATPTSGMNVASVSPQSSRNDFIGVPKLLDEEDEDQGEDHGTAEEQCGVLLDPAGLDVAKRLARLLGARAGGEDETVDDLLVDLGVQHATGGDRGRAGGVDDGVEDVVVEPVGRP